MREIAMKKFNYQDHHEIPADMANYIVMCADAHSVHQIPLDEINDFLNDLEDWQDGAVA